MHSTQIAINGVTAISNSIIYKAMAVFRNYTGYDHII